MKTYTEQELKAILEKHRKWVMNESDGERADLSGAYLSRADLRGADLSGAYLSRADLSGAYLSRAYLSRANLRGADLSGADLSGADLHGADLYRANLSWAYLSRADLHEADLSGADLSGANLSRADLSRANLSGANLSEIKEDFFKRLLIAKAEVVGLYDYLIRGKIDGYFYAGECACFVGSIAKIRKEGVDELSIDLKPDSSSLTERWFLGINEGDTPQSNQVSAITAEWIREFAKEHSIKLPEYKLVSSFEFPQAFEGVKE